MIISVYESIAAFQGKSQACVLQSLQDVETSFAESDSAGKVDKFIGNF